MKKVVAIIPLLVFVCTLFAQQKITIKDDFMGGRFRWGEDYDKKAGTMVSLQDGKLVLTNKNDLTKILAYCDYPIPVREDKEDRLEDFAIKAVFTTPVVNDEDWFGIIFNFEDEDNFEAFVVEARIGRIIRYVNGERSLRRRIPIVLKKGKKNNVELTIEQKGRRLIFGNDGMEVYGSSSDIAVHNSCFGFVRFGKGTLTVESLEVTMRGQQ